MIGGHSRTVILLSFGMLRINLLACFVSQFCWNSQRQRKAGRFIHIIIQNFDIIFCLHAPQQGSLCLKKPHSIIRSSPCLTVFLGLKASPFRHQTKMKSICPNIQFIIFCSKRTEHFQNSFPCSKWLQR